MMNELDDSPVSYRYEKMADHIESRIISGDLKPYTPLPAERRLAVEYGVSLGTARRATELLRERQLVITLRPKGTFIIEHSAALARKQGDASQSAGVVDEANQRRRPPDPPDRGSPRVEGSAPRGRCARRSAV